MILNQAQAEAVYIAMCALNNVGGRMAAMMEFRTANEVQVTQQADGQVLVLKDIGLTCERHADQAAFAVAYDLHQPEPVAQVAEDYVFMLRKQPNGDRWPVGTKLYA